MKKKLLIFLIIFVLMIVALTIYGSIQNNKVIKEYSSDSDYFNITYDVKYDRYDIYLENEDRHIYVYRNNTEIIVSGNNEIKITEYKSGRAKIVFYEKFKSA